jgi:hypothetical protein
MTKIKRYVIDSDVTGQDKWIGSDSASGGRTKNFTASGLSDFYNKGEGIDQTNSLKFLYDTVDVGDDRKSGSFSFPTELGATVPISTLSSLIFHNRTVGGSDYVTYIRSMIGSTVILQSAKNPSIFGYFTLESFDDIVGEKSFKTCSLTYISGSGSIVEDEYYFVSLLQLNNETDKHYTHNQNNASAVWNVTHNLEKHPSVSVVLSTGQQGLADVQYINNNELTITLLSAQSGKAYLN